MLFSLRSWGDFFLFLSLFSSRLMALRSRFSMRFWPFAHLLMFSSVFSTDCYLEARETPETALAHLESGDMLNDWTGRLLFGEPALSILWRFNKGGRLSLYAEPDPFDEFIIFASDSSYFLVTFRANLFFTGVLIPSNILSGVIDWLIKSSVRSEFGRIVFYAVWFRFLKPVDVWGRLNFSFIPVATKRSITSFAWIFCSLSLYAFSSKILFGSTLGCSGFD